MACSCGGDPHPLSEEKVRETIINEFNESSLVFSGEAAEIDRFKVKFEVMSLWKGDVVDEVTMSTGTVKIDENYARSWGCAYKFKVGEKYMVYAHAFGGELVAWQCRRTNLLSRAEQDVTELDNLNPNAYRSPTSSYSRFKWKSHWGAAQSASVSSRAWPWRWLLRGRQADSGLEHLGRADLILVAELWRAI